MVVLVGLAWVGVAEAAAPGVLTDDWALADGLRNPQGALRVEVVGRVVASLQADDLQSRFDALRKAQTPPNDPQWWTLYIDACTRRRAQRLKPHMTLLRRVVFTKHYDMGGSHYAYTEGQSDAQAESHFKPGSALCLLEMERPDRLGKVNTLIDDPTGVIRDPEVSWDADRILFAWKKSKKKDDYHLYDLTVATKKVRQLTDGLGFADYEAAYLPNGDIVFNSTRCVQTVDCWWTEVSNLYTCDGEGRYLRRLSYDQVHTNYPTVTPDGRVIYTRWDYSDRGQVFPQGLFQMNADGTAQRALYGNNSWFPTTILHARAIPGADKIVAIFTGHHTHQRGKLGILDPARGHEENAGAQLIAPIRKTFAVRIDCYGQNGAQFQYPYPLSESAFIVAMDPIGSPRHHYPRPYALYWVDVDGQRELLAHDPKISCNQPVPLRARRRPDVQPSRVDYRQRTGTYYMQDIYFGPGLAGVKRGAIKKLRIVEIGYRAAGIGMNNSSGPAGGALSSTPVSAGNGCWDTKTILGDATVYPDGSACFEVPAHTPVYFIALDKNNHAVQTMRSWSTLQPGERMSCVGCHESPNTSPPPNATTTAMQRGPQKLTPFHGPQRGFSFPKEIQPILDRHCISCHDDRNQSINPNREADAPVPDEGKAFSLTGQATHDPIAKRHWSDSYLALVGAQKSRRGALSGRINRLVNWISVQSAPPMLKPYSAGAARSELITLLESGHGNVKLTNAEMDKIAAWIDLLVPYCGDYTEANAWSEAEKKMYAHFLAKRQQQKLREQDSMIQWMNRHAAKQEAAR